MTSEKWKYKADGAKKCPFCDSDSVSVAHAEMRFLGQTYWGMKKIKMKAYCVCNKCHAHGKPIVYIGYTSQGDNGYSKEHLPIYSCGEDAIKAWNRRVSNDRS